MSDFIDIEKHIEDSIVRTLRALFSIDPDYTVDLDNLANSKIRITSSKPRDPDHSLPSAYLSNVSYQVSDISLNNSYAGDIINKEGKQSEVNIYLVSFNCVIVVTSIRSSEAKNFANRIVDWLWMRARRCIEDNFNTKITSVRKSPGSIARLSENKEFFTETIQLAGSTKIQSVYYDLDISGILEKVNILTEIEIEANIN